VVRVAHLLGLQVYTGSFETGQWGEIARHFSKYGHLVGLGSARRSVSRLSTGWRVVQDVTGSSAL
jgi:hypothetical protein